MANAIVARVDSDCQDADSELSRYQAAYGG
jgi:hypothetical protein